MRLMAFAETVKGGVYICSRVIPSFIPSFIPSSTSSVMASVMIDVYLSVGLWLLHRTEPTEVLKSLTPPKVVNNSVKSACKVYVCGWALRVNMSVPEACDVDSREKWDVTLSNKYFFEPFLAISCRKILLMKN